MVWKPFWADPTFEGEFELTANRTGRVFSTGEVVYNYQGQYEYYFKTVGDFVTYAINHLNVNHNEQEYDEEKTATIGEDSYSNFGGDIPVEEISDEVLEYLGVALKEK